MATHFFPAFKAGLWRYHYEQENFPAEQPSSCQGARIPASHAYPRGSCHPWRSSSQGSHRTVRVITLVLARANRVTQPGDFRATVRQGRRVSTANAVLHVRTTGDEPSRFGFIVTKAVGGAVTRNLVRRRLRAVCRDILPTVGTGADVVIRALPGSDTVSWVSLHDEIADGVGKAVRRG